jgi:hypothetical protein
MWWLMLSGSIAAWKEEDAKKKEGRKSNSNMPLQDKTNAASTPVVKRIAFPMIDGPLRKKVKDANDSLNLTCSKINDNNGDGKYVLPALLNCRHDEDDDDDDNNDDGISNLLVVALPTEADVNGQS